MLGSLDAAMRPDRYLEGPQVHYLTTSEDTQQALSQSGWKELEVRRQMPVTVDSRSRRNHASANVEHALLLCRCYHPCRLLRAAVSMDSCMPHELIVTGWQVISNWVLSLS